MEVPENLDNFLCCLKQDRSFIIIATVLGSTSFLLSTAILCCFMRRLPKKQESLEMVSRNSKVASNDLQIKRVISFAKSEEISENSVAYSLSCGNTLNIEPPYMLGALPKAADEDCVDINSEGGGSDHSSDFCQIVNDIYDSSYVGFDKNQNQLCSTMSAENDDKFFNNQKEEASSMNDHYYEDPDLLGNNFSMDKNSQAENLEYMRTKDDFNSYYSDIIPENTELNYKLSSDINNSTLCKDSYPKNNSDEFYDSNSYSPITKSFSYFENNDRMQQSLKGETTSQDIQIPAINNYEDDLEHVYEDPDLLN